MGAEPLVAQGNGSVAPACDHTIRRCCQGNFHADYRRWLDLFSDELIEIGKIARGYHGGAFSLGD
jgi:hypothetical protein